MPSAQTGPRLDAIGDGLLDFALARLAAHRRLNGGDPIASARNGPRGVSYYRLHGAERELHLKMGRAAEALFTREVEAISLVPASVRPETVDVFGLAGDFGQPCFLVQPFYESIELVTRPPAEQWILVLAAADVAAVLWSHRRLHFDLARSIFFVDAASRRLVLLDYNDVVRWPLTGARGWLTVQFQDGVHPDLVDDPASYLHGWPVGRSATEIATRLSGCEDRFLAYSVAHLLALGASVANGDLVSRHAAGRARLRRALVDAYRESGAVIDVVLRALAPDIERRPSLADLRDALAEGASLLAGACPDGIADPISYACAAYLRGRGSSVEGDQ